MRKFGFIFFNIVSLAAFCTEPLETSKLQYKQHYQSIAIEQMQLYKIPASITLAQGILESGSGNSSLAKEYNNHFGIKCHSNWTGETVYFDDDAKNECFRAYKKADDSYKDHSLFLTNNKRYQGLFSLNTSDYKGWAKGLKEAGYATSPAYATLLITIIEELKLYELDNNTTPNNPIFSNALTSENLMHSNHVQFVKAKAGDSYYKISKRHGITLRQLHKYNEQIPNIDILEEGTIIYLAPRRNHSRVKKYIVLDEPKTLREIAQQEAVKLKPIMRKNEISSPDEQLPKGEKIFLR